MKRQLILIAIGLLGLVTPFSFGQNNPAANAAAVTTANAKSDKATPHRGLLYRVRHKGNTSYLFGTIHVGKSAFYPLGAEVMSAFSKASKVALEFDIHNTEAIKAAMQKYALYGADDSIKNHLSPDTFTQLKLALEKANIPLDSIMQMKPWFVASVLVSLEFERSGYDRSQGIEDFLLKSARKNKKQVVELESADFQFALFNSMSDQQHAEFLEETLAGIKDGKARKEIDELADAWGKADIKTFARLIDEALSEKTATAEFTQRVLLDQRNPGMTQKIEGLLKHDKITFVGVGLLHLIGEKSVPALLRQRGYVVERVY